MRRGQTVGVALIADAEQGKGSWQSILAPVVVSEYHRQAGQGTCHSRATATQFESDAVKVNARCERTTKHRDEMKRFSAPNHGRKGNAFGSSHLINAILKKSARTNTPHYLQHPRCFRSMRRNSIHQRRRQPQNHPKHIRQSPQSSSGALV